MAKGKRSVRPEFIFGAVFILIILFALVLDWWRTHAVIGWTIIGILVVLFIFFLYKSPDFRNWILKKGKIAGGKVALESTDQAESVKKRENIDIDKAPPPSKAEGAELISAVQNKDDNIAIVKVPLLSEAEKARLINAVGSRCEKPRCRNEQNLEVHHIKPRAEGGTNNRRNLIVLCPICHTAADRGAFSRALLREWISRPRRFRFHFNWQYK